MLLLTIFGPKALMQAVEKKKIKDGKHPIRIKRLDPTHQRNRFFQLKIAKDSKYFT